MSLKIEKSSDLKSALHDFEYQSNDGSSICSKENKCLNSFKASKTPILTEILLSSSDFLLKPYVLKLNNDDNHSCYHHGELTKTNNRKLCKNNDLKSQIDYLTNIFYDTKEPSKNVDDYFEIQPEQSREMEKSGIENSLFLSVARAILYKLNFVDKKYEFMLRNIYLDKELCHKNKFKIESDMSLQFLLRKKLCFHWLSQIRNGKYVDESSKYVKNFEDVYDFIYQTYQISVNNFSRNKLFEQYAVEDLAKLLKVKIITFEDDKLFKYDDPLMMSSNVNNKFNDYIFLKKTTNEKISDYKWLMPKFFQNFIQNDILSSKNCFLFNLTKAYSSYTILVNSSNLYKCFDEQTLNKNFNQMLFVKFLSESTVHTLISLTNLRFKSVVESNDKKKMIDFLNDLWGQDHFYLEEPSHQDTQFNSATTSSSSQDLYSKLLNDLNRNYFNDYLKSLAPPPSTMNHPIDLSKNSKYTKNSSVVSLIDLKNDSLFEKKLDSSLSTSSTSNYTTASSTSSTSSSTESSCFTRNKSVSIPDLNKIYNK